MAKKSSKKPELPIENKSIMEFPCEFPIKIIGHTSPEFEIEVLSIIRKHVSELKETAVQSRPSKNGKYQAVTVTIVATSREQLDTIYRELTASPLVMLVF